MKFVAGFLLAAVAVAGVSAESTNTLTVDPKTLTRVDPATIEGLGPQTPAGDNPEVKKAMEEFSKGSGTDSYYTIDPRTLPTENPTYLNSLGPQVPIKDHRQLDSTNALQIDPMSLPTENPDYLGGLGPQTLAGDSPKLKKTLAGSHDIAGSGNYYTFDPHSLPTQDPKYLEGFGPMTSAGNNPKIKKAMNELASKEEGSTTTLDTTKTAPSSSNPAMFEGLGPAVLYGMPGHGQNAQFNKAWKEFQKQEDASTTGSLATNCAQVCPDVYDPVCGTDNVTYSNSCELGIASCKNPENEIAKKTVGRCQPNRR